MSRIFAWGARRNGKRELVVDHLVPSFLSCCRRNIDDFRNGRHRRSDRVDVHPLLPRRALPEPRPLPPILRLPPRVERAPHLCEILFLHPSPQDGFEQLSPDAPRLSSRMLDRVHESCLRILALDNVLVRGVQDRLVCHSSGHEAAELTEEVTLCDERRRIVSCLTVGDGGEENAAELLNLCSERCDLARECGVGVLGGVSCGAFLDECSLEVGDECSGLAFFDDRGLEVLDPLNENRNDTLLVSHRVG